MTVSPAIALHPGSGSARKNWPLERWQALVDHLLATYPSREILLVGGEADREQLETFRRTPNERLRLVENLSLPDLAVKLAGCAMFVGHDSGISHLAAAAGTKCRLLFGPTDPAIWAPLNEEVKVLRASDGTMESISLGEVKAAIETALAE